MRYRKNKANGNKLVSEINVTPLVDVILVLLIIFMVTAPMLQMGIDINLPQVKAKTIDVAEEKLILTINKKGDIFINNYRTSLPDLTVKLENIFKTRIEKEVFMRADKEIPYGYVVEVMSAVRKAGVDKLGMITEPPKPR